MAPTALEDVVRRGSWLLHEMLGAFRSGRQAREAGAVARMHKPQLGLCLSKFSLASNMQKPQYAPAEEPEVVAAVADLDRIEPTT
ncbi:hypothetical protein [Streptantibioticus silvisoli]|uniref:Uncharacterized protein n=1 Tax=Streptantibioticus silvisoli TaxID=2705255 RepID=A0ABT6W0L0_9ACTN|nr:hypothetical protein [Streptantibioticus silvisoli]MDI5963497.1 hypothetical protein [Streptantibioticus silvisoli]